MMGRQQTTTQRAAAISAIFPLVRWIGVVDKRCNTCHEVKPSRQFYRHPGNTDGLLGRCKECHKSAMTENRNRNIERIRAYDRARGNRQTKEYREQYVKTKPKVYSAQNKVSNSVRDGKITRGVLCQYCGTYAPLHAHHTDYDKPLDVQWLCVPCHKRWHIYHGEAANAT